MLIGIRLVVLLVLVCTFSSEALAQRFSQYKDPNLCLPGGFSSVIRSSDGPEFYAYAEYGLSAPVPVYRFLRTPDSLFCSSIATAGAVLPTTRMGYAQMLYLRDTMYLASRKATYLSSAWGLWESEGIQRGSREMIVSSLNPLPDGRILATAFSYIVAHRDTTNGVIGTLIDSAKVHLGYMSGLMFNEIETETELGRSDMHMLGATTPDGTTYLSTYRGSENTPLMFEVGSNGDVYAIPPPAGLAGAYQSPVIVRVGNHIVYAFYGAWRSENTSLPACYVRYDRRTQMSTRHIIDSPYPSGGWSGDTLALVVGNGTVHVVRENSVSTYRIMDQINDLPWVPSFYSVHRTSSTEWLIGSNSGIFFFELDATTSIDDNTPPQHPDRFATTSRSFDLTLHASTSDAPTWTVLDALGRICTEGTGTIVSLPTPSGLYIVKYDTGLITVLAM